MWKPFAKPSFARAWSRYHERLPAVVWRDDGTVEVQHVRHARYTSEHEYEVMYTDEVYDPRKVVRVWFGIEPYARFQAHTFLSFEFDDGRFLSSSVEVRKTSTEDFWGWQVLVWNYEIFYNVADEQDVLFLRTNIRKDRVHLYPLKISRDVAEQVFRAMLTSVERYSAQPFWYRITHRNCTTEPFADLRAGGVPVPLWHWRYSLTEFVDKVLYRAGVIDTDAPYEVVRARHLITDRAQSFACDEAFSKKVREGLV